MIRFSSMYEQWFVLLSCLGCNFLDFSEKAELALTKPALNRRNRKVFILIATLFIFLCTELFIRINYVYPKINALIMYIDLVMLIVFILYAAQMILTPVFIAKDDARTILTMMNDIEYYLRPSPIVLKRLMIFSKSGIYFYLTLAGLITIGNLADGFHAGPEGLRRVLEAYTSTLIHGYAIIYCLLCFYVVIHCQIVGYLVFKHVSCSVYDPIFERPGFVLVLSYFLHDRRKVFERVKLPQLKRIISKLLDIIECMNRLFSHYMLFFLILIIFFSIYCICNVMLMRKYGEDITIKQNKWVAIGFQFDTWCQLFLMAFHTRLSNCQTDWLIESILRILSNRAVKEEYKEDLSLIVELLNTHNVNLSVFYTFEVDYSLWFYLFNVTLSMVLFFNSALGV